MNDQESEQSWNSIAEIYQEKFMEIPIYNSCYDVFLGKLNAKNSSVLDAACGPGNISNYLLKHRPDLKITGIDYSPNMIELARKNNPSANFKVLDFKKIRSLEMQFDGIICGFGIPFLNELELESFIADCSHLLNTKAPLYLSFEAGDYENSGYKLGVNRNRVYFHYYNVDTLSQLFLKNGLKPPQIFTVEFNTSATYPQEHTIVITEKI